MNPEQLQLSNLSRSLLRFLFFGASQTPTVWTTLLVTSVFPAFLERSSRNVCGLWIYVHVLITYSASIRDSAPFSLRGSFQPRNLSQDGSTLLHFICIFGCSSKTEWLNHPKSGKTEYDQKLQFLSVCTLLVKDKLPKESVVFVGVEDFLRQTHQTSSDRLRS